MLRSITELFAKLKYSPKLFDEIYYLEQNPDVVKAGISALLHYRRFGWLEGRNPHPLFHGKWYQNQIANLVVEPVNPVEHYENGGWRRLISPHPLFSVEYYFEKRPDVRGADREPVVHFIQHGWREGSNPHPMFDVEFYLSQLPNFASLNVDPLTHYLTIGWKQGLRPSEAFDASGYLYAYPDVGASGMNPLVHYVLYGEKEGRNPFRRSAGTPASGAGPEIKPALPEYEKIAVSDLCRRNAEILFAISGGRSPKQNLRTSEVNLGYAKLGLLGTEAGPTVEAMRCSLRYASAHQGPSPTEMLMGLGITPEKTINEGSLPSNPVPILNRYNLGRLEVTRRFELDPSRSGTCRFGPTISILMPVYKTPIIFLERAILSVLFQTYANWELLIVDDCSNEPGVEELVRHYTTVDPRIRASFSRRNGGISAATNAALEMARGSYVGLLDHDDMLTRDALEKVADRLAADSKIDLVYSDECKIDVYDVVDDLFHKPDWSPLALLNCLYTGHFSVYRKAIIEEVGGFRSQFDFSQDYDLALRVAEKTPNVSHIGECLYGWRMIAGSAAAGDKPDARLSNVAALQDAADRRGYNGVAVALPAANRVRRSLGVERPLVSIIVPSDNAVNIKNTVQSIEAQTAYEDYEIVIVTNSALIAAHSFEIASEKARSVVYDKPYNFSDKCNAGASDAKGDYIIFFNDDVRVISPDWIEGILECLTLPGVGVVGPKLLYENGTIQHAGMVTGVRRLVGTAFHTFPSQTTAYFNLAQSVRETSLICGACLAMPIHVFNEIGGFDTRNMPIAHSDVDLCFRVREQGYSCVYTPHVELTHIGHVSIGAVEEEIKKKAKKFEKDKADIFLLKRWGEYCERDPYFPPKMRDLIYIDSQEPFRYFPPTRRLELNGSDVLIFSHDLSGSGAPKIVFDIARLLVEQGCFVVVISPEDGVFRNRLLEIGVHVIVEPLALSGHDSITSLGKNFDLIIANTAVCWPVLHQLHSHVSVYWYIHETQLIDHLANVYPGFLDAFKYATAVWVGSALAGDVLRRYGIASAILEYGVEDPHESLHFQVNRFESDKVTISVLATYEPRKGQDLAILGYLAMPEEYRRRCRLCLAGRVNDDHFRKDIEALAAGDDTIYFEGELDFSSYLDRLSTSDIVVCSSRDDTLPLVSLNALAEGKILICSQETGTSKYIQDGISGFVLSYNHPDEIAATLTRALDNIQNWEEIGRSARNVFLENFSRQRFRSCILKELGLAEVPSSVGDFGAIPDESVYRDDRKLAN
jgi:O-antigen biosynthesis protein